MKISPGYDKDPLRPKLHRVVRKVRQIGPNEWEWENVGNSTAEAIELLRLSVGMNHAVGMKTEDLVILGEDRTVEATFENYRPVPQPEGTPIGEENARIRDRWIKSIVCWLIPRDLADCYDNNLFREEIARALVDAKAEISVRPDGRAVVIFRDGATLASWAC